MEWLAHQTKGRIIVNIAVTKRPFVICLIYYKMFYIYIYIIRWFERKVKRDLPPVQNGGSILKTFLAKENVEH